MQTINKEVKTYLEKNFKGVRETKKGFRINFEKLTKLDLLFLYDVPCTNEVLIKRSGTGLVVIIE